MNRANLSVSVVLPGYNEEANIEDTVGKCVSALRSFTDRYEVVIVDDGSTDQMPTIADRLAREDSAIKVIHNPVNLHVGISLLIGMNAASGDVVAHNAMDYPFDMQDLDKVLPLFPEWDVVIIARTDRSAHSKWRKLTSWVHYWMVRILFGVKFGDMNFVQVYKKDVLRSVKVKAKSPAFVTVELLIRARDQGFKITEVRAPFHSRNKGAASYGKPRDILWTLADMISFWLERRRPRPAAAANAGRQDAGAPAAAVEAKES